MNWIGSTTCEGNNKKLVLKIHVPGIQERIWLETYITQKAAAAGAHKIVVYLLFMILEKWYDFVNLIVQ